MSIFLSVRLSVTLVDQEHIGWKSWKLNCTNNLSNTFALRSLKIIYLLLGEHREILGRLDVGWGKVVCWSIKAAISLKRVEIEEKLQWRAYRRSQTLFRTVPSPTPMASSSPKLGFCNPTQKFQSQQRVKPRTSNLAGRFTGLVFINMICGPSGSAYLPAKVAILE